MRTPLTLLVPLLALLLGGCGGAPSPDLEPVITQAERVGQLLDADRPCEALEAMRALDTLAERAGDPEVDATVSAFISDARATVTCGGDPQPSPTPGDEPPAAREEEPPSPDRDDDQGDDRDDEDDDRDDEGRGPGDDSDDSGDGRPGRGLGRDKGRGRG